MTEVLKFDDVRVRRGDNMLLDGIDLAVSEGQNWVILGPNGAGKTTLLELAAGRMHPTSGTVHILEEQMGRVDVFELRPRIGYASAALAGRIPGSETVINAVVTASYGVLGRWVEEYDEMDLDRARDLLGAFNMAEFAERAFGTLSEGEKKRVQIARALMTDPELLLLDECASGLDLGGREELLMALSEILVDKYAPTTLMVTHHVEEIPVGVTHALLLKDGRAVAAGPIDQVLTEDNLHETFGLNVVLSREAGRYSARARL
ncbi:ABC transporter ATP-binding protein [Brevibacterium sp. 50QC2O2]|uniref:ABC transporter ATP-binding protein n=1 Tax=Brevibacterium TaxID=1696 RepID=UPI00211CCE92|nr:MULTISPECIES: ABC transporter ATP-binding protein [unclassified Brevibacterium]MCQ9366735.1 ABC transporter ATP-binding protein [Brevibacterium sp. 91QC2O2]MCQ9384293.1 ABC transporter ATP-binding protein [Brevibacterium sp. 68QC2CO]MCQ9388912.1 ABC transporter ATP-binding protein [Brevibacterium sp. 50QC2O2]